MIYPFARLPKTQTQIQTPTQTTTSYNPRSTHNQRKSTPAFSEQEHEISVLKKENFSLKMRIYYLSMNMENLTPDSLRGIVVEHAELKSILALQKNNDTSVGATTIGTTTIGTTTIGTTTVGTTTIGTTASNTVRANTKNTTVGADLIGDTLKALGTTSDHDQLRPKQLQTQEQTIPQSQLDSYKKESERKSKDLKLQIKALNRVRQILIDQLKSARHDLKKSILVNTQAQQHIKSRRSIKFISKALAEMSEELDMITLKIYKDLVTQSNKMHL